MIRYAVYDKATGEIKRICISSNQAMMDSDVDSLHDVVRCGPEVRDTTHQVRGAGKSRRIEAKEEKDA